jgi:hypothetical protein
VHSRAAAHGSGAGDDGPASRRASYRGDVPTSTTLDDLLQELKRDVVEPECYSRKSLYGRCEPLMSTTAFAVLVIGLGMLLGGWGRSDDRERCTAASRAIAQVPQADGR